MKLALAAAVMFSTGTAEAAPTFLKCTLTNNDGTPLAVEIQLNEQAGTASTSFPEDGSSFTYRAVFTPTHVAFNGWTVSRMDLTLERHNGDWGPPPVSHGRCVLDKRVRAF